MILLSKSLRKTGKKEKAAIQWLPLSGCAEEEIRTPMPGKRRYHLKVVRLPISPPPQQAANLVEKLIA
jgi:hypothetical protein